MNKKNGFTLVELMVVIVIIGVLAAVAIPKMMAATNKAKAGEGPQILRSVASMQAAFKAENDTYINATSVNGESATTSTVTDGWYELGFDQQPKSRYFGFQVTGAVDATSDGVYSAKAESFIATATLTAGLGDAVSGQTLAIDQQDERTGDAQLKKLVPNWR